MEKSGILGKNAKDFFPIRMNSCFGKESREWDLI